MPNQVDTNTLSLSFRDQSFEVSTVNFNVQSLTDNATYVAARDALETAIGNVTNGRQSKTVESAITIDSNLVGADGSFREQKWLVRYEDSTTKKIYRNEIPTADFANATFTAGTDFLVLTSGDGATLVSALEALVASPVGNAIEVISIEAVGRNI